MLEVIYSILVLGTMVCIMYAIYKFIRFNKKLASLDSDENVQITEILDSIFKITITISFLYLILSGFNIFLEIQCEAIWGNWICACVWIISSLKCLKVSNLLKEDEEVEKKE